jgi:hypothetical protein
MDVLIDRATGADLERPINPTPEQVEAAKRLASDVLSDLRHYYPDVVKTRPATWPIHLRNTIAQKVARLLSEQS